MTGIAPTEVVRRLDGSQLERTDRAQPLPVVPRRGAPP
jgi:hypothetical protein